MKIYTPNATTAIRIMNSSVKMMEIAFPLHINVTVIMTVVTIQMNVIVQVI